MISNYAKFIEKNNAIDFLVIDESGCDMHILPEKGWELKGKQLEIPYVG